MPKFEECTKCGLPHYAKKVKLNKQGICSFCSFDENNNLGLRDFEKNKKLFQRRIEAVKGKYKYDAIVGVSGGKDGAYVLHKLVNDYKLKVLTFTYDNAFISDIAREYIEKLVRLYDVDHVYYTPKNIVPMYRGIMKLTGIPCNVCGLAGYGIGSKLALDHKVPLGVHGRSPHQMHRILDEFSLSTNISVNYIMSNLKDFDPADAIERYKASHKYISFVINKMPIPKEEKRLIMAEFFDHFRTVTIDFVPESYGYFLTEKYDEQHIRNVLKDAGYTTPPTHADCKIHNVAGYMASVQEGISFDVREAAVMRRWDEIDKEEFDELLHLRRNELENPTEEIESEMKYLSESLSISLKDVKRPSPVLIQKFVESIMVFLAKKNQ